MYHDCPDTYRVKDKFVGRRIDYKDKDSLVNYYFRLFLNKTQSMFEWKNLPDTIPQRDLELLVQTSGHAVFVPNEDKTKFYALWGTLGGRWNFNYMPTRAIIANPYLPKLNGSYEIFYGWDKDGTYPVNDVPPKGECVVIPNDALYTGIEPILIKYANRLADTYISRRVVTIMSRYINVFLAKDDNTYKNIKDFLKHVEDGDLSAILDDQQTFAKDESVYTLPMAANAGSARMLTELIECEQYDKASLYNELGLQANYNMKREAINSNESQLNQDALFPLVDTMLASRKLACERINKLFGLDVSVDFSSVWKLTREQIKNSLDEQKSQTSGQNLEKEEQDEGKYDSDGNVGDNDDDGDNGGA